MNNKFYFLLIAAICICFDNIYATDVSGNQSGTWTKANSPYILTDSVTVPIGSTLIIEPGVIIQFPAAQYKSLFTVRGTLIARGSITDSIYFKGADEIKGKQKSGSIVFQPESINSVMQYASLDLLGGYTGNLGPLSASIIIRSNSCQVINCFFGNIRGTALQIYKCTPLISDNLFKKNTYLNVIADIDRIRYLKNNGSLKIGLTADLPVVLDDTLPGTNEYTLLANQTIPVNKTLVINPGAKIQFSRNYYVSNTNNITINGTLKATGTTKDSIYFNGFLASNQDYFAGRILFESTSENSVIKYANINSLGYGVEYGSTDDIPAIIIKTSSCTISNNRINKMNSAALEIYKCTPVITNNVFDNTVLDVRTHPDFIRELKTNNPLKIGLTDNLPISTNDTLTNYHKYYKLLIDLTIPQNKTVVIQSGVQFLFNLMSLSVSGTLKAIGTATDSIRFTGGGGIYDAKTGGTMMFGKEGMHSIIQYVDINNLGVHIKADFNAAVKVQSEDFKIENCTLRDIKGTALEIDSVSAIVNNNKFLNNSNLDVNTTLDKLKLLKNNNALKIGLLRSSTKDDDTLLNTHNFYRILYNQQVSLNNTLVIQPGTELQFSNNLVVNGTLKAAGEVSNYIKFNYVANSSTQFRNQIVLEATSKNSILQYVNFNKLGNLYADITLTIKSSLCRIANCIFSNSSGVAIGILNASSPLLERNCFFYNHGAIIADGGTPVIKECNFIANFIGIKNVGTNFIDGSNCFWNDVLGPSSTDNLQGKGDSVVGNVLYKPFATEQFDCAERVLPITLTNFKAAALKSFVTLSWQTATEVNTSHFNIQRSINRIEFANLGKVAASGISTVVKRYEFLDKQPGNGINYYRLQMVDADGRYSYSKIIPVNMVIAKTFGVYPNPAKNTITAFIQSDKQQKITMQITDINGKIVKLQQVQLQQGANTIYFNTTNLTKGAYAIVVQGLNIKAKHFVKQ